MALGQRPDGHAFRPGVPPDLLEQLHPRHLPSPCPSMCALAPWTGSKTAPGWGQIKGSLGRQVGPDQNVTPNQAYYRLSRTVPPAQGAELNRRLARALGADPSGWDLTQLLRVPATVNHKYEGQPAVRLVASTSAEYAPEQLDQHLPRLPAQSHVREVSTGSLPLPPVGSDPPIPLTRLALAVWNGEDVKVTPDG
jgi:hypothetical protein